MPLGFATLISYLVYDAMGGKAIYDVLGRPWKEAAILSPDEHSTHAGALQQPAHQQRRTAAVLIPRFSAALSQFTHDKRNM